MSNTKWQGLGFNWVQVVCKSSQVDKKKKLTAFVCLVEQHCRMGKLCSMTRVFS